MAEECLKAQTQSINTQLKLFLYKWLGTYVTPTLLNKFNSHIPDTCAKCGEKGTLIHCLWECPEIQKFWKEVLDKISYSTGIKLNPCPKLCILGFFSTENRLSKVDRKKHNLLFGTGKIQYSQVLEIYCLTSSETLVVHVIELSCPRGTHLYD